MDCTSSEETTCMYLGGGVSTHVFCIFLTLIGSVHVRDRISDLVNFGKYQFNYSDDSTELV